MKGLIIFCTLIVCFCKHEVNSVNLPGPLVYVVTPSPRPPKVDKGRSAPFYYHNWIRRMDSPRNSTSTTTTTTPKTKTPDLIFAEFESGNGGNMKSIRKLLEKEKIETKVTTTTTTSRPIYVPDDEPNDVAQEEDDYGLPLQSTENKKIEEQSATDTTDYFALYNKLYNSAPAPVYVPSTASTSTTTTTTTPAPSNVENIWHIIDSQKYDQYSGKWEEEPVASENNKNTSETKSEVDEEDNKNTEKNEEDSVDENFAVPGFGTNSGSGAENESRAIRTEPNIRFPYVSLKPFQIKTSKKPLLNTLSSNKKGNNMFTNLDNFYDIKNPVRGEAQDVVSMRQPVDRYNPAQPYLPPTDYGSKSKQSSPDTTPVKFVANLVPPPPPKLTGNDFPAPTSYESFPPYAPAAPVSNPAPPPPPPPPPAPKPITMYQPPVDIPDDTGPEPDSTQEDSDGPQMDLGYRYKAPPSPKFLPTLPPLTKPFSGYSYDKPMSNDAPSDDMGSKPDFHGYHYSKPEIPSPPQEYPSSYHDHDHGHHDSPPYHHDNDYPELIFNKPHGGMKGGDDMKDMGMVPPPPPPDMKPDMDHGPPMNDGPPVDDHGFPHDFPGDFKFHHDFDDDDYHHHHHHTTTTTTTEMPRVNRYSYYYLGKKLYYLPLYFSVYFIIYVGALIIKAVLRHKIVYPNSWRPNGTTASFFSKRSIDSWDLSNEKLHEITGKVTNAIAVAGEKYMSERKKK